MDWEINMNTMWLFTDGYSIQIDTSNCPVLGAPVTISVEWSLNGVILTESFTVTVG